MCLKPPKSCITYGTRGPNSVISDPVSCYLLNRYADQDPLRIAVGEDVINQMKDVSHYDSVFDFEDPGSCLTLSNKLKESNR
jgi:hypothetical protein